ncbi:hypothetical protein BaRGS_00016539 [Batillaria attramentaria]|uniref:Chloride channel protein n=1 Tax=Batillaria attramentaria TaxID=370345 RepID=A0ABD0KYE5_9CAEN
MVIVQFFPPPLDNSGDPCYWICTPNTMDSDAGVTRHLQSDESTDSTNGSSQLRHRTHPQSTDGAGGDNGAAPLWDSAGRRPRSISKYGSSAKAPDDDNVFYVNDDNYGAFTAGRDYEPIYITHKYTEKEKETLAGFESLDYLPPHSHVYKHWIKRQMVSRLQLDRWLMMGMIGFVIGLMGFFMHQLIEQIVDFKWDTIEDLIDDENMGLAWLFSVGYSVAFVLFSAALVIFWRPSAGGSGVPEVTGFLNGTRIRHIFSIQTMVAKFFSCVAAIGSGMPVGPEGPMIHLGALVGAGVSQFRSETLNFKLPFFERFRNSEDRRNFISAGAAAGVASAFGSPIGGLLFSMEEVSSFWTTTLSWQIFFCCMVSTFTTDLFNSAFEGFRYMGDFGQFKTMRYILFNIDKGVDVNILMFIPTVLLGVLGGGFGAFFTILNLKVQRLRKRILSGMTVKWKQSIVRLAEPAILMVLVATASLFLPDAFSCTQYTCVPPNSTEIREGCINSTTSPYHVDIGAVVPYTCPSGSIYQQNGTWATNGTYSELASLLFGTTEQAVRLLFSRSTHVMFNYGALSVAFVFYYLFTCLACGTALASGILVPMLLIGGIYGRMVGLGMVSLFGVHTDKTSYWKWMDPGAFALIGAASFFGGVTRLTMAVTVIMMELTNDVQVLLPVMVSVMVAKWIGDFFTHPIFHAVLEMKCIPFLESDPRVTIMGKSIKLELYTVKNVMTSPVVTVCERASVQELAAIMLNTCHGGFPVLHIKANGKGRFIGIITRLELMVLLSKEDLFEESDGNGPSDISHDVNWVEFEELLIDKLANPEAKADMLKRYIEEDRYKNKYLDLTYYYNQSAFSIPEQFSLQRTYVLFRTLGLRHLTVVDKHNEVTGIVTRKDLMGFNMVERLSEVMQVELDKLEHGTELQHSDDVGVAGDPDSVVLNSV